MQILPNTSSLGWSGLSRPELMQVVYVDNRRGRGRLHEIPHQYHCSIIGTCLTPSEVRKLLAKLQISGVAEMTEGEAHHHAVMIARDRRHSKLINKALDNKYSGTIRLFSKYTDTTSLRSGWRDLAARGDIAGAYWATLSHEHVDGKLSVEVFDEVHMLSHLVSTNVRAETRRIWLLEAESDVLLRKLQRQQAHIRDGFAKRDAEIRAARELAAPSAAGSDTPSSNDDTDLRRTITDLRAQLQRQEAHEKRLRDRANELTAEVHRLTGSTRKLESTLEQQRQELEAAEDHLSRTMGEDTSPPPHLRGATILYIGGAPRQVPCLRHAVESGGGAFLHHDGGSESSQGLIPALVARADVTVFPVDHVSHGAMHIMKKSCQNAQRPFLALRVASVSCLIANFGRIRELLAGGTASARHSSPTTADQVRSQST